MPDSNSFERRSFSEGEGKYRSLIRKVPTAIVLHDGQGRLLDSNPLAEELLGLSAEQLLGKALIDPEWHFLREDGSVLPVAEYPVSQVLSLRQPLRNYVIGISPPERDDVSWVLVNAEPEYDEAGEIALVIVSFVDITERRRAEVALYEAQQVFRTLVESSPDIIARYDRDCRRTYVNPTYLKVAQISQQELLATTPSERSPLPAASAEVLQNLLRRVLENGIAEAVDVIWPKVGNIDYWYNISAFPEFDREGRVASVMAVSRDITERKRFEEALRESEEKYRRLLDTVQEGIWVIDRESITTFANPRLAEMMGYATAEMIGKPLFAFMDEQGKLIAESNVERRKQGIKEQHDFEFIRKDGERIYTRLETGPLLDEAGQYAGAIAAVADITERRKAEEALNRLNEELEQRVRERTKELERRNHELEQMNKVFVGRELKMVELKKRIKELETRIPDNTKA